eukprot:TRINITY_DN6220_c0_g1_i1.p1 TRINITY_DN6220_c0_g1~~TRINITY_DN6220_c0_g1_i1.p1  ORF type:complete len:109 (+),score=13.41 TRINITY_DN6220_c0_g1_i1:65-391(+)
MAPQCEQGVDSGHLSEQYKLADGDISDVDSCGTAAPFPTDSILPPWSRQTSSGDGVDLLKCPLRAHFAGLPPTLADTDSEAPDPDEDIMNRFRLVARKLALGSSRRAS